MDVRCCLTAAFSVDVFSSSVYSSGRPKRAARVEKEEGDTARLRPVLLAGGERKTDARTQVTHARTPTSLLFHPMRTKKGGGGNYLYAAPLFFLVAYAGPTGYKKKDRREAQAILKSN